MKLYVCYGFLKDVRTTGRPGGHPCGNAHVALKDAGHSPEVIPVHGLGVPPLNKLGKRDEVERVSGQRRVPVLVDGDVVVVESRRVVRHLYSRYGDDSFARSIAELDRDILADGDAPVAGEACEVPGAHRSAG